RWLIGSFAVGLLLTGLVAVPSAHAQSCDELEAEGADLRCILLVPTAEFSPATGLILLERPASPFGVAVSRDGKPRHELRADIGGLPVRPDTFYVVWLVSEFLAPVKKLGVVRNGLTQLGEVSLNKFIVLISA